LSSDVDSHHDRLRAKVGGREARAPPSLDRGVKIAAGTDAGFGDVPHGGNARELTLLAKGGMTAM
jgi:imidazolonepropionase-like amidohydrolase